MYVYYNPPGQNPTGRLLARLSLISRSCTIIVADAYDVCDYSLRLTVLLGYIIRDRHDTRTLIPRLHDQANIDQTSSWLVQLTYSSSSSQLDRVNGV